MPIERPPTTNHEGSVPTEPCRDDRQKLHQRVRGLQRVQVPGNSSYEGGSDLEDKVRSLRFHVLCKASEERLPGQCPFEMKNSIEIIVSVE